LAKAGGVVMERLSSREIVIMRSLVTRGASLAAVSLVEWQRQLVVPLWRRGLVEIWYRQALDSQPSFQGPYYRLTINGARLASYFLPAPRGISGADRV
jgi:hypothetical protein